MIKILLVALYVLIGVGIGYALFNKQIDPPNSNIKDNSKEKKSGTKIVYLPSKCDGKPQEIAYVEKYESNTEKDVKSNSIETPQDNFMGESDFSSEVGIKYKPFDNIPVLNKLWLGADYNKNHNEVKLKAAFTTRLNL